jgi:hypothetical protein
MSGSFTSSSSESNEETVIPTPPNLDGYAYPVNYILVKCLMKNPMKKHSEFKLPVSINVRTDHSTK